MNKKYNIVSLILTLIISIIKVDAQYNDIACAGTSRIYKTTGNPGSTFEWTIDGGGSITITYGDSIEVTWGNKAGTYNIQVIQTTKYGCKAAPLVAKVKLSSPPIVNLGNDIKICSGQTISLDAGTGFTSYNWNNGNTNQQITIDSPGKYKIVATDADGCSMTDSINIEGAISPKVYLGRDTSLCEGETLELIAGPNTDTLQYLWSDKTSSYYKVITINDFPMVSVKITSLSGCSVSDSIIILPCNLGNYINSELAKAQNTITPNGDGKNDTWEIPLLNKYPNTSIQIYDRWGRIVYRSEHGLPPNGWDGTSQGRILPMDSYQYIIDLKVDGAKHSGIITIVR